MTGTENVITACRREGVGKLIYTSTPSVVFGARDLEGVDESVPYASSYETAYPETKAIAERKVLQSNGPELAHRCLEAPSHLGARETTIWFRESWPAAGQAS